MKFEIREKEIHIYPETPQDSAYIEMLGFKKLEDVGVVESRHFTSLNLSNPDAVDYIAIIRRQANHEV